MAVGYFTIQRDDGDWYAGQGADGAPQWTRDLERRQVFDSEAEATRALRELQQAGHSVRLFALLNRQ